MQRGIMIPPIDSRSSKKGSSFSIYGTGPLLHHIPTAILYWDKLHTPVAMRGFDQDYDDIVDQLVSLGAAESIDLKESNSLAFMDIGGLVKKYKDTLTKLNSREDEVWSVAQMEADQEVALSEQTSAYFQASKTGATSLEVEIKGALPVPNRDIPYEDLLEFKSRRKDQIQKLHSEISQVASKYSSMLESEKATKLALNEVNSAISELQRVFNEKWTISAVQNLRAAFLLEGAAPAFLTLAAGLPIERSFLAGAGWSIARSFIAASVDEKYKSNPYCYAVNVDRL